MNIRAVVADVDGVMVGKRPGFNFPLPHADVITALRAVNENGIPIILCTAKFYIGIKQIAVAAHLDNPHITDGGALIINLMRDEIIRQHVLPKDLVKSFVSACIANNLYVELYTAADYYVQRDQVIDFTSQRSKLLQQEPTVVENLQAIAESEPIIKMIFFAKNPDKQAFGEHLTMSLGDRVHFIWSHHPFLDPWKPGVITAAGVSKAHAMNELLQSLEISPEAALGIGDSLSDWNFMSKCGACAVVGSKDQALITTAITKGEGRYCLAGSVDDHGLIEVLQYFQLLKQ